MSALESKSCTAFVGHRQVATGSRMDVAVALKKAVDNLTEMLPVMVFDDETSRPVEFDLRGSLDDVRRRLSGGMGGDRTSGSAVRRGPGRPKLGVVSGEVTLLPRHWAWLRSQRGGASATIRRLVDGARQASEHKDRTRAAQDSTYRFCSAMGGDLPGFEEAMRALFSGKADRFREELAGWPCDVRAHAVRVSAGAFGEPASELGELPVGSPGGPRV